MLHSIRPLLSAAKAGRVMGLSGRRFESTAVKISAEKIKNEEVAHQKHLESGLTHGHEPAKDLEADAVSGAPAELHLRTVRIYKPGKTTMQSGKVGSNHWRIDFDTLQGNGRWSNPLMGWASGDYMQGTHLKFLSEDDAIHFCEKQGWNYVISKPNVQPFVPKNYAENYLYNKTELRLARTK